ncbi:MAG TPA: helix-turn-helix domain-containing protein, partial [Patescibacteria group bacterium]|nr:helix-turn-helix domain-containing protein [Patescibacteria group bacterium]
MPFKRQSINHSELGSYLKKLREEKNDSLEAAARSTGISLKYLKALEAEDFEKLPGLIYAKNFLKNYLIFLGGDIEKGMEMLNPAKAAADSKNKKNKSIAPKVIFTPRRIELGIVLLIILGVFGYFFYEA